MLFRAPDLPAAGVLFRQLLWPAAGGEVYTPAWRLTILAILEISLSFDNAVVNVSVLQRMSRRWQRERTAAQQPAAAV